MSCWLFHKWSRWSDPIPGEAICFNKWKQSIYVQERKCKQCNKRELAEDLYNGMAEMKTNCPNGTMLSAAVLCDYAGKMHFIKWIEQRLATAEDKQVQDE